MRAFVYITIALVALLPCSGNVIAQEEGAAAPQEAPASPVSSPVAEEATVTPPAAPAPAGEPLNIEEARTAYVAQINAAAPVKLDDLTNIISAAAHESGITFTARIDQSAEEIGDSAERQRDLRLTAVATACSDPFLGRAMNEYGQTLSYIYHDRVDSPVTTLTIAQVDCAEQAATEPSAP